MNIILGFLLIVISFMPLLQIFPELKGVQGLPPPAQWLWGGLILFGLAILCCLLLPRAARDGALRALSLLRTKENYVLSLALALLSAILVFIVFYSFEARYHLIDTVAQMFQAKIFATGRLFAPAPSEPEFFIAQNMLIESGKWYSQYPPGHAALLALGQLLGVPWAVPVLLTTATVFLLWSFSRRSFGADTALLVLLFSLSSPFLLFMGASYMNHVSAAFFLSLALLALFRWECGGRRAWLAVSSLAWGGAFLCRPYSSLVLGAASGVSLLVFRGERRLKIPDVLILACGVIASVAALMLYNQLTTGDALLLGYTKLWGRGHGLGFHETPWGESHSLLRGLINQAADLQLLNEYLTGWPIPALLLLALYPLFSKSPSLWSKRLLLLFLALPLGQVFYWHRDQFLGPRFLYEGVVFLIPLLSWSVVCLCSSLPERCFLGKFVVIRPYLVCAVFLSVLYSCTVSIPAMAKVHRSSLSSSKGDVLSQLRNDGVSEGLVFVSVSWGNRILSRLRGYGVKASLTEKAYRGVDHCLLHELLERVDDGLLARQALPHELEQLFARGEAVVRVRNLNADPTLRLRPRVQLSKQCQEEILYDREGYFTFTADLLANSPLLDGHFVVARDLRRLNSRLRQHYPGKRSYLMRPRGYSILEEE